MKIAQILGSAAALLVLTAAAGAAASPVPADTVVQNVNGVQQCVMTYTVPPGFDSGVLQKEPFELDGYEYTFSSVNRVENYHEDKKSQTETVTVNTAQQELSAVLAKLPSTKEYSDGKYSGTLTLNTSTIRTEAAGYETSSYPVSATREFDGLDSNDPSYLPFTTSKDGVTLTLQSVDWQVEASDLVEDMLVPSSYRAVATYSGTGYRKTPTGYVSTASYTGTVSCRVLQDITYTVTYLGTALPEPVTQSEPLASSDTQDSVAEPDVVPGDGTVESNGVIAETGVGFPVNGSGKNEEMPGSGDEAAGNMEASAELLAGKTGGEDLNQQDSEEPEEESLSQILYIILGIITVILIIALLAWLYIRWQKRRAAVLGDEYQDDGAGYPPDSYMGSADGQYPGEYPDEGAYGVPQGSYDATGNPYAMADPYTVEDPYPDGGVSPEGIPYYGQGAYAGQEFYPPDAGAQDDDRADRSEYPDESGFPEESSFPENADGQDGASLESGDGQESEIHQPRFLPETGYIPEE